MRGLHGCGHLAKYRLGPLKPHLLLGRVHVHIHLGRIQFEVEYKGRMPAMVEHVAIGLLDRMGYQLVANHSSIDEKILQIGLAAGERGQADPARQPKIRRLLIDLYRAADELFGQHPGQPPLRRAGRQRELAAPGPLIQRQAHIETGQADAADDPIDVALLRALRFQELPTSRGVEEQIADLDRGALRVRGRLVGFRTTLARCCRLRGRLRDWLRDKSSARGS